MASQLELEKLLNAGERLGLKGHELKEWVDEQRDILKQERDDERNERAKQRVREQEQKAFEQEQKAREQEQKERQVEMEINAQKEILASQQKAKQDEINAQKEILEMQLKIEEAKRAQAEAYAQAGNNGPGSHGTQSKKAKPPSHLKKVLTT